MKMAIQINLTFEQILSIVRQPSKREKLELSRELEKDAIDSKLTKLLDEFKTDELDEETINQETESVRQKMYCD
ncbi:MAG: hypothetical protein WBA59_01255 [Moheibacter sp.]